jgi:hypothetical protein
MLLSSYSYVLIGLTLQDMKQVTSVAFNITWGQELFRLVCYVAKSQGVPITAYNLKSNCTCVIPLLQK